MTNDDMMRELARTAEPVPEAVLADAKAAFKVRRLRRIAIAGLVTFSMLGSGLVCDHLFFDCDAMLPSVPGVVMPHRTFGRPNACLWHFLP